MMDAAASLPVRTFEDMPAARPPTKNSNESMKMKKRRNFCHMGMTLGSPTGCENGGSSSLPATGSTSTL
jgi:hypothetical protein